MTSFKITFQRLLLAGLVAGTTATAFAQTAQPAQPVQADAPAAAHERKGPQMRGQHAPGDHQAARSKRQAELKQQLQITSAQERDAKSAMTTPQRIERMRAMRSERDAAMDRRADATLKLYAALTPDQQKVFDTRMARQDARHGPHGHGQHEGPRGAHTVPNKG